LGGKLTDILESNINNFQSKIVVLPNAVTSQNENTNRDYNSIKLKLLFIARFAHNKGIHILLEAIKQLNDEGYADKLEFNLGGKGPLFEYYSTNFKYANVNYMGFVSDEQLTKLYKTNDIFVFPTLFEGMPTVVLEAMSYGMPVIVSDVGATSELVNETNGYLINRNSTNFYNLSSKEKQGLSDQAFSHLINNYTWNIVSKKHFDLFYDLENVKNKI
jgi:glycosyltransferase involved in cell wall biosynthesis